MQTFWTSKRFYSYLVTIIVAVGAIFTGEKTFATSIPEIVVAVLGVLGIIFSWNNDQSIGMSNR